MPQQESPLIPLHYLPSRPTGIPYPERDSIDALPSPGLEPTHAARMNEMLNRTATPPPFPDALPPRPNKQGMNKWMLASVALLIALLGSVIPLGVLLGVAKAKASNRPAESGVLAAEVPAPATTTMMITHTATMMMTHTALSTIIHVQNITATATETQLQTTTELQPTTITSVAIFSFPSISYITATITLPPSQTGIDTSTSLNPEQCDASDQPFMLGRNACVMVKACNEKRLDIPSNDCKGFCAASCGCLLEKGDWPSTSGPLGVL